MLCYEAWLTIQLRKGEMSVLECVLGEKKGFWEAIYSIGRQYSNGAERQ